MFGDKTLQSIADAVRKVMEEELKGKQKVLDKNKNNKLDAEDFKLLRKEEQEVQQEGWDDMLKAAAEKRKPQPNGGAGKKQGTAYGGSKQKDEKETMKEEATQDEFNAELQKTKAKADGKDKADVAKAAVTSVKQESVELEERTLTEPEMKKREEVVKSMKKGGGLQGFKARYGARGKEVMYATATKIAKKD